MRTERDPAATANANRESTVRNDRGIRNLPDRPGRPKPYGVQWSEFVWDAAKGRNKRKVRSKFFPTEALRDKHAAKLRQAKRDGALRTLSHLEMSEWLAFKEATRGFPWTEVVYGWQAWRESKTASTKPARSVAQVATAYLAALKARADDGDVALNTYRQHKHKIGLFVTRFGPVPIDQISQEHVEKWLQTCGLNAAGTHNNYLKIVSLLFTFAKTKNPCEDIRRRREGSEEDRKLTVPQIAQLFHTANTNARFRICLRRLALETFAGVRFSSACRLLDSDIDPVDRGIRHRGSTIKTGERMYVSPYPEVLFKWLAVAPSDERLNYTDKKGKLNRERRYLELKSELFHVARVPHPKNCLRHSFPTYHLAKRGNPGETAYLLCHKNQLKLWNYYKGDATKAEGERFEALTPETVESVAREWSRESGGETPRGEARPT